jgi:uncharacterized membrane protein YhaH (DUF805 family)
MNAPRLAALLRFLFSTRGRATRRDYWIVNTLPFVAGLIATIAPPPMDLGTLLFIALPTMAVVSWPAFVVGARRCHDRGHSGWYQLIGAVPYLGSLWLLYELGMMKGTYGANRYGADPLQRPPLDL